MSDAEGVTAETGGCVTSTVRQPTTYQQVALEAWVIANNCARCPQNERGVQAAIPSRHGGRTAVI